ncbi:hypothetical protein KFZ76_09960 [Methylovulum psychrotolerans]|jgi:hypothetical protein|uniref:hypothetical protein n=1 Tax=Methylovulum psychrotolerans TaxID=1704499 RepID=UPI001BFF5A94|nr:hypothetical protein [Methylovulum psychrotolerans]MBT9098025.1 hypothetical protein [Methylovulum psychrotolerans]
MRTIKTVDGEEISGRNSSFEDKGDYIVKSDMMSETKIYKNNIILDKKDNSETVLAAAAIILGIPFLGS